MCAKSSEQARNFHMGRLRVEERLLAMVVTKIIMPRGSNHATLNEGDLVVVYCIENGVMVDWTYTICDHMIKAKRLTDFKLPYVVLISKFIKHFGVDVERELEESTGLLNHVSTLNMHKMGFTKIGNTWLVEGDQGVNIEVGANDHEARTSGENQEEDEPQPMAIELYNPPGNTGPAYSQFERMVLNQLQDLNMEQNAHHAYCTTRFQDLDDQLHNVHDLLSNVYNRDNARNERRGWLIGHALHFHAAFYVSAVCSSILIGYFFILVD